MDSLFEKIDKIIHSPIWSLSLYVFGFFLVVLWMALILWTFKDARKRIDDPIIVGVAVLTSLVLPLWAQSSTPSCGRPSIWPRPGSASWRHGPWSRSCRPCGPALPAVS